VQEMVIYGVSFDMVGKQPIVLLKTVDSNKFLPIWIGHPEAAAILMKLQGATTPRPMTHDLLCDMLGELEVKCTQVAVTELRDNTFFASITLNVNGRDVEIDSRPSDALALALRCGARICVARKVIDRANRIDKRPDVAAADAADRAADGDPGDGDPPGILEQLDDEDFGKWKM
jgi:uncharacterized protein